MILEGLILILGDIVPGLENVLYFKVQYSPHFESMVILHMYSVGDV